jgi:hypothetical protein
VLRQAGYTASGALVLSGRAEVDLHLAVRLLKDGHLADTAMRILL